MRTERLRRLRVPRPKVGDLLAGLSVAFILVPQALAYAELAGLPPVRGVFAAILPPIAAALVASSPYLQTGPVAMTSLLTFGALNAVSTPGTVEYIALAGLLAVVVGVVRLVVGIAGLGGIAYFMSRPVMIGFTSAAGILIVASQLPNALGVSDPRGSKIVSRAFDALTSPDAWSLAAVLLSVVAIGLVLVAPRVHPLIPGVVIASVVGVLAVIVFGYEGRTVGALDAGLPIFTSSIPWSALPDLLLPGAVIALIGFAEPAAIARTYATQERSRWDPSREFIGQGLANVAAGVSAAFPVGGSFSRTALAKLVGAKTRWAGAFTGMVVLLVAVSPLIHILEDLPVAVLSAIVIGAVITIIRPDRIITIARYSRPQGLVAATTFVLTLVLSPRIDQAVVLGIGLGVAIHLVREMRIDLAVMLEGTVITLRPGGVLYFASAEALRDALAEALERAPDATHLRIDLSALGRIDYTGALILRELASEAEDAGLEASLERVPARSRRIIDRVWYERTLWPGWGSWWDRWQATR